VAARALTKDDLDAVTEALLAEGALAIDFGFTAYATTAYLKRGARAGAIEGGGKRVVVARAPQGGWKAQQDAVKPGWQQGQQEQQEQEQGQQERKAKVGANSDDDDDVIFVSESGPLPKRAKQSCAGNAK
jgi:hypothetical protein